MSAQPIDETSALMPRRRRARHEVAPLPHIAALYCRVSTKKQGEDDKASLPTQLAALKELAARLGYAVADQYIYQDKHSGEELHERRDLSRLREDARARRFAIVLAYNSYALAKKQAHMAILVDEWQHIGIGLQFAIEEFDNSALGQAINSLNTYATEVDSERRKDRIHRALMARVESGKPAHSARATYGYRWTDERDRGGRLLRERLEKHPQTWPVLERIWAEGLAGRTQRAIAQGLTDDHVPTPMGGTRWEAGTIHYILTNPVYWGRGMTLRRVRVPVPPHLRKFYARRTKQVDRPVEEQVPLPPDYAPAVVTPEAAAVVQARMRLNQQLATPKNPDPQELLRGIARCAYCGRGLLVARHAQPSTYRSRGRSTYRCRKGNRFSGACSKHSIEVHRLDAAVWATLKEVLSNPEFIRQEVQRLHETPDPGASTLETIDRQLADVARRIRNKRQYAEQVDDDRERAEVAAEVALLRKQERDLEVERAATQAHFADWQAQQAGLEQTLDWCVRWAGNLDALTLAERCATLLALKADVCLWRADHTPRAEMTITLPLSGARILAVRAAW
jgi:DNA invertase Pin-like site-specific DNA recombinase